MDYCYTNIVLTPLYALLDIIILSLLSFAATMADELDLGFTCESICCGIRARFDGCLSLMLIRWQQFNMPRGAICL